MKPNLTSLIAIYSLSTPHHLVELFEPYRLFIIQVIQPIGIVASTVWFIMLWVNYFRKNGR